MSIRSCSLYGVFVTLLLGQAGCGGQPYVHYVDEFNRESEYYLKGITEKNRAEICYAPRKTNALRIENLAADECRKFGKIAEFYKTSYNSCPLNTPVAAVYKCVRQARK